MKRFKADLENIGNVIIIRLIGELDASTAVAADDALQEAITNATVNSIIIDCTQLNYISSAGLGVVLSSLHACKSMHKRVVFFGLQPKIKNVFTILGIEKIIATAENESEAMRTLNGNI